MSNISKGDFSKLSMSDTISIIKEVMERKSNFVFCAHGNSMYPIIKDGDKIMISPINNRPLKIGDIIAFHNNNHLVVHRIYRIFGSEIITKGDNLKLCDNAVSQENVLGIVTKLERNGKNIKFGIDKYNKLIAFLSKYNILLILKKIYHTLRK